MLKLPLLKFVCGDLSQEVEAVDGLYTVKFTAPQSDTPMSIERILVYQDGEKIDELGHCMELYSGDTIDVKYNFKVTYIGSQVFTTLS